MPILGLMTFISDKELEQLLIRVQRPGRYIGLELNSVKKEFSPDKLKIALCYPDLYEVGMSNFSLRILYEIINADPDLLAERVFLPALDMLQVLNAEHLPLFSLESRCCLSDFDILGFTVQYELNFLPLLQVLKYAHIPLKQIERGEACPLIIGGGSGLANPEPIADFFDLFVIGEAEDIIVDLLKKIKKYKTEKLPKKEILIHLNKIEYCYVPSLEKDKVKRHIVADLNKVYHPVKQLIPFLDIVQDRGIVEIDRGCLNGCRFCQAGYYYRPKRERDMAQVVSIVEELITHTGYNIITLLSLSVSNYSCLQELLKALNNRFAEKGISFSLPSIRIDRFTLDLLEEINTVRKSGLTFALETADEDLQKMINKPVDLQNFIDTLVYIARHKWRTIKIYLMIGFSEDNKEIEALQKLMDRVIEQLKQEKLSMTINLNVNPVIFKPLTPLEYLPQVRFQVIEDKLRMLKDIFLNKYYKKWINLKWQDISFSVLESILARGDRGLAPLLDDLAKDDSMDNFVSEPVRISPWLDLFRKHGLDPDNYLYKEEYLRTRANKRLDFHFRPDFMQQEYEKFKSKEDNKNCFESSCYQCGVCQNSTPLYKARAADIDLPGKKRIKNTERYYYKAVFRKTGFFRFISHRDIYTVIEKAFRRIDLPILYTEGFNKRMRFSVIFPLPLMVEGENELLEFVTDQLVDVPAVTAELARIFSSPDFFIKSITPGDKRSLNQLVRYSEYRIVFKNRKLLQTLSDRIKLQDEITCRILRDEELELMMPRDKSVVKFLMQELNYELTGLWQEIDKLSRQQMII